MCRPGAGLDTKEGTRKAKTKGKAAPSSTANKRAGQKTDAKALWETWSVPGTMKRNLHLELADGHSPCVTGEEEEKEEQEIGRDATSETHIAHNRKETEEDHFETRTVVPF